MSYAEPQKTAYGRNSGRQNVVFPRPDCRVQQGVGCSLGAAHHAKAHLFRSKAVYTTAALEVFILRSTQAHGASQNPKL